MTIGEKIKNLRLKRGLTQAKLCGTEITRNLLSEIECGKASPSIQTLKYIAGRLDISAAYFLTEQDDLLFFEKKDIIEEVVFLYKNEQYAKCIKQIERLGSLDDELCYILANCYFSLGKSCVMSGSLLSAKNYLEKAEESAVKTAYDTSKIKHLIIMYKALAENIQSPLLEFDVKNFELGIDPDFEHELYRYITADYEFKYKNPIYRKHAEAKNLIKDRQYSRALSLLEEITEDKNPKTYNSYVMFGVYTDMEYCSKQLANFEAAYKFASKRLSMLEGFKA